MVVIIANSALLLTRLVWHSELVDWAETGCLWFFVGELMLRLHRCGWRPHMFVRRFWNIADAVILGVAFLPAFGAGVTLLRITRLAKILHLGRHASHLMLSRLILRR